MKKTAFLLLISIVILYNPNGFSQDTLLLLSGKKLPIANYRFDVKSNLINYSTLKGKTYSIYSFDVFSIHFKNGKDTIFYRQDILSEDPNTEQMRRYINGEIAADKEFRCKGAVISSFLVGAGSPYLFTAMGVDAGLSLVVPISFGIGIGRSMPNTIRFIKSYLSHTDDVYYTLGYSEIMRKKKTNKTLISGATGWAVGMLVGILTGVYKFK
jgi:hypothetical protein